MPVAATFSEDDVELTPRQGEVLDAALSLLVTAGDRLTMTAVAARASCSKETLYKWFGDRDGLLRAVVQWQAAKVGVPQVDKGHLSTIALREAIESFARGLLKVLSSETSVALNRLAISHAGHDKSRLGQVVLQNGRFAMGKRLKPVLEAGREAGLLRFEDSEAAFRVFFGLVVRDVQVRLLLGDDLHPTAQEIAADARNGTEQFFTLFGA